jgi:hypothetical protein
VRFRTRYYLSLLLGGQWRQCTLEHLQIYVNGVRMQVVASDLPVSHITRLDSVIVSEIEAKNENSSVTNPHR